jgi:hypothetical protein
MEGGTIMERGLAASFDWRGQGIAVKHICSIKNFECVLLLGQKQPGGVTMNVNAEKVMEFTQISHGKFGGERGNNGMEKSGGVCCEDNVINIQN